MKHLLTIIALFLATHFTYAQEQEELNKKDAKEEYCMVLASSKFMSTKVNIDVDFGQAWSFWKDKRGLKDANGKKMEFNSVVDALNYMSSLGWEFVNAYAISVNSQNVYHYVMKRELTDEDKESAE